MLTQLYVCGRFVLANISRAVTHPSGAAIAGANVALENGMRISKTGFQNSVSDRCSGSGRAGVPLEGSRVAQRATGRPQESTSC
jgi:hypothetical protein